MTSILSSPTSPKGALELMQGEAAIHHPAPECEGEIAARESLEPKGAHNGLTAGRVPATHKEACRSCDGTGYAESQHADGHASTGTCWRCGGLGFIETIDRKEAHERSNRL
jgi:hypothetical protein